MHLEGTVKLVTTQVEMLEFCARKNIGATVVTRPMAEINEALADLESSKGAHRFVLTR